MLTSKLTNALDAFDGTNGEAVDLIAGLYELVGDFEKALDIINSENWFNFYTDINSYTELAGEMLGDETLWEEGKDEFYDFLNGNHTEEEFRRELYSCGWHISKSGLAIGFDDYTASYVVKNSLILGKLDLKIVRDMQSFMELIIKMKETFYLNVTEESAYKLLDKENLEPETYIITKAAIKEYLKGSVNYKIYERSFFLKEISKEKAEKLYKSRDEELYALYDGGQESLIKNEEEFENTDTYGVEIKY